MGGSRGQGAPDSIRLAAFIPADVAAPIAHFVSFEVGNLIHPISRLGFLARLRHRAFIAVFGMKTVVYTTLKMIGAVKPRTSSNEDTASKPLRTVVTVGGAAIRSGVIVTIGAYWGRSDFDSDLSLCFLGVSREADCSNGG